MSEQHPHSLNIRVKHLFVYPLKSARPISLNTADVNERGIRGDREWMLIRSDKRENPSSDGVQTGWSFVSGREEPLLLTIQPSFHPITKNLVLTLPNKKSIEIRPPDTVERYPIRLWQTTCYGEDQGHDAHAFFNGYFECDDPVRLVRVAQSRKLSDCTKYGHLAKEGDVASFSDWSSFSIGNMASLDWLNQTINDENQYKITQFRPNIVVEGKVPFEEDTWKRLRIGNMTFRNVKCTARCMMTTINERGEHYERFEPLRTLKKCRLAEQEYLPKDSRFHGKQAFFCCNLIHDSKAKGDESQEQKPLSLNVGDVVTPLTFKPSYHFSVHSGL